MDAAQRIMTDELIAPISEIFTAPQGEGLWSGTLMTFIRFAGCNVGKSIQRRKEQECNEYGGGPAIGSGLVSTSNYGVIPIWQEECTLYDGRKFLCDTDFRVKERLTPKEILSRVPVGVEHICLTGGEPLLHVKIIDLLCDMWEEDYHKPCCNIHIETSGTKIYDRREPWITVSPKDNCTMEMVMRAEEIKLLVDENFDERKTEVLISYADSECIIWLSAVNGIKVLDERNIKKCIEIQQRHPNWRITNQNHKLWGTK